MENAKLKIYSCLFKAYSWLFNSAINSGNWEEVRSTALAALCLRLREPIGSEWLIVIKKWLLEKQTQMGKETASWGNELWDTSVALIALNGLGLSEKDPQFQKSLSYIKALYDVNGRHNWHDEPWETSWCLRAILEIDATQLFGITYDAACWLLSLQEASGRLVSPHYSAYFIQISHSLISKLNLTGEKRDAFDAAVNKAADYLINNIVEENL